MRAAGGREVGARLGAAGRTNKRRRPHARAQTSWHKGPAAAAITTGGRSLGPTGHGRGCVQQTNYRPSLLLRQPTFASDARTRSPAPSLSRRARPRKFQSNNKNLGGDSCPLKLQRSSASWAPICANLRPCQLIRGAQAWPPGGRRGPSSSQATGGAGSPHAL